MIMYTNQTDASPSKYVFQSDVNPSNYISSENNLNTLMPKKEKHKSKDKEE